MRAINSALILAEKRGEKLHVLWNVNAELGCPFEELFLPTDRFTLRNFHTKYDPGKLFLQFTNHRIGNEDIRSNRDEMGLKKEYFESLPSRLFIATEEHFFPNHDYSAFAPSAEILARADAITKGYGKRCVGIHIRRTDNKPAIGKSSTDAFVSAMEKELTAHPETVFFLATDDLSEEKKLRELFPDKILSHEDRDLSRASVSGIKDALLDLICLSRTEKIIGSFFSSFTDIAADMNGIEKIIAGEDNA
ncbi:MAG: hypothetical protein K6E84_03575 [Lachnospiraceae bacterium]|nr:hypothetical protein [Lachnospiraceae bacterium]